MYCLSNVCFICLKYEDIDNCVILQHAENEIVQQVQFVFPEIVILEPRLPLLICSTCRQEIDAFHKFKKMCLDNNCHYNDYINKLRRYNSNSERKCSELQVQVQANLLLTNIKEEGNINSNIEDVKADDILEEVSRDIKVDPEEFVISEDSTDSFYQQILKYETEYNNVQDCEQIITNDIHFSEQESTKDMSQATDLKCSVCNEIFAEISVLKKHMMTIHSSVKEKKCFICNKIFKHAVSLPKHMKIHIAVKDYECSLCKKMFSQNVRLKQHMTVHTGVKDYECSICKKMFSQKGNLKQHMTVHTGVKDYKCSICNKLFTMKHRLNSHMATHTGVKNYRCLLCNKSFVQSSDLNRHMTVHSGANDYKCSLCNKLFTYKYRLKSHMATHTLV